MIRFLAKLAVARILGGAAARVQPKGIKGMVMKAVLQRFMRR